jgi:hypothetical protein
VEKFGGGVLGLTARGFLPLYGADAMGLRRGTSSWRPGRLEAVACAHGGTCGSNARGHLGRSLRFGGARLSGEY